MCDSGTHDVLPSTQTMLVRIIHTTLQGTSQPGKCSYLLVIHSPVLSLERWNSLKSACRKIHNLRDSTKRCGFLEVAKSILMNGIGAPTGQTESN